MENKTGTSFDELIFSELRLVSYDSTETELTDENLAKAMTVNEELINIGYSLAPKDIIALSRSTSLDGFFSHVKSLVGEVKAAPMYPDFPTQVMELTEAQFRFQQLLHYMTTYGMESIMGTPVEKGWLPCPDAPQKTEKDTRLLESKVIALVPEQKKYIYAISKVTEKRERMTDKEILIVKNGVAECSTEQLSALSIPFKQNLLDVFYCIFDSGTERQQKINCLRSVCQHSGDAWKCLDYVITRKHYHLRTSEKKVLVKLLESFSANDFRENIILSIKKAERIKVLLPFISFDNLSRSPEHIKVIRELRDGKLHSWTAKGIELIKSDPDKAVEYFSKRPGELLRRVNFLLKYGASEEKLTSALLEMSDKLSIQTIIMTINSYDRIINKCENAVEAAKLFNTSKSEVININNVSIEVYKIPEKIDNLRRVMNIFRTVLAERLKHVTIGLEGKKVYIDMHNYNLEYSVLNFNEKSAEGGYIRSGLAYNLPENIERMRFFVYWNHPTRVDIDLHASAVDHNGRSICIGWNSDYRKGDTIIFSGDITHSDAAEYVDFVVDSNIREIAANINIYYGPDTFKEIETVFVGVMAVDKFGKEIQLYSSENCFYSHYLTSKCRTINYGYIDAVNRFLLFEGQETNGCYDIIKHHKPSFSLKNYLDMLIETHNIELVESPEEADNVLIMEKPSGEKEISLIDNNFFTD